MTNLIFLTVFSSLVYGICRYFADLTKDKESHKDGGFLNRLFFARMLLVIGLPILGIFIVDIFRIGLASNQLFWLSGSLMVALGFGLGHLVYQKRSKH